MQLRLKLARRIRSLRIERGYSVAVLAERAGVHRNYIMRLESRTPPRVTVETLAKIAAALGVKLVDLLS